MAVRPVKLGLVNMFSSRWLTFSSFTLGNVWLPAQQNFLKVGAWAPTLKIVDTICVGVDVSIKSSWVLNSHTLHCSREQGGNFHATDGDDAIFSCADLFPVGSHPRLDPGQRKYLIVSAKSTLGSLVMKSMPRGVITSTEFLFDRSHFITCSTPSAPVGTGIMTANMACSDLERWSELAGLATFTSMCLAGSSCHMLRANSWALAAAGIVCLAGWGNRMQSSVFSFHTVSACCSVSQRVCVPELSVDLFRFDLLSGKPIDWVADCLRPPTGWCFRSPRLVALNERSEPLLAASYCPPQQICRKF